jgi:hypothetical protein
MIRMTTKYFGYVSIELVFGQKKRAAEATPFSKLCNLLRLFEF